MLDLSIIVITWKMRDFVTALLQSTEERAHGISYETILVDNHSGDGTIEAIESQFPSCPRVWR
jgi:hypothetical protein